MNTKRLLLSLASVLLLSNVWASEYKYRKQSFQDYITGNISQWGGLINEMRQAPWLSDEESVDLLTYYYGYMGYLHDADMTTQESSYLSEAQRLCNNLLKQYPNAPELPGLQSNFTGLEISLSPYKAPFLAFGMMSTAKQAFEQHPDNAYANIFYGNLLFYIPSALGGDKKEALACYQKALSVMQETPGMRENNWLYVQLQITIGLVYQSLGDFTTTKNIFQQLMATYPNYLPLKNKLYPALLKQMP